MPITRMLSLLSLSLAAYGQGQTEPHFEVASIKSAVSPRELRLRGQPVPTAAFSPGRTHLYGTLQTFIRKAYNLRPYQKLTGPDWMGDKWFELVANLPEGATQGQVPAMLKALLAERFKLVVRWDPKEQPVYVLSVAKDGPKLKEASPAANANSEWSSKLAGRVPVMRTTTADGWTLYSRLGGSYALDANKISVPDLALAISREVGQPVLDQTGLPGLYEVSMPVPGTWLADMARSAGTPDGPIVGASEPASANITKSVEKLGLLLKKTRATIDNLVIERVEKLPTEN